jgi:response regulator RpfG family c-di-GMP phosphodiesterase
MALPKAIELIQAGAGVHFDAEFVEAFVSRVVPKLPVPA